MAPFNKAILEKYIQGKCTPEEEQELLNWLDYNDLDEYKLAESKAVVEKRLQKNWNLLARRIPALKITGSFTKWNERRKLWIAAAVIGGLIILGVGLSLQPGNRHSISYSTKYGEVKSVLLPDGTIAILNATSSIVLADKYNKTNRTVYLEGEAFFQVKQHAGKPFIVQAGKLHITALGTSFDVSAFGNENKITVALKDGKVAVRMRLKGKKQVILAPGEEVIYDKGHPKQLKVERQFDEKEHLAWRKQIIYFQNANLQDVKHKLERFYGVTIDARAIRHRAWKLSGEYKNETLDNILKSLSFNYGLQYDIEGNRVILTEE